MPKKMGGDFLSCFLRDNGNRVEHKCGDAQFEITTQHSFLSPELPTLQDVVVSWRGPVGGSAGQGSRAGGCLLTGLLSGHTLLLELLSP